MTTSKKRRRLARLTPREDHAWTEAFSRHLLHARCGPKNADRRAWRDVQKEFPTTANLQGVFAMIGRHAPPKINLTDFYALLAKTPRDWYLTERGMMRRKPGSGCQCPLSAVQDRTARTPYNVAFNIGLPHADAAEIIAAADGREWCSSSIRNELLRACGLEAAK